MRLVISRRSPFDPGAGCTPGRDLICFPTGGRKDHRQDPAGLGESGEDLPRGEDHEDAGPPTYH